VTNGPKPQIELKKAAYNRGLWAERYAEVMLWLKGYRTLARRHKTPKGEIDLIMRRGSQLVFIEVKFRQDLEAGLLALTPRQLSRIEQAGLYYTSHMPVLASLDQRIDLVVVRPWSWPTHILNLS
jgi:putative endonuclease